MKAQAICPMAIIKANPDPEMKPVATTNPVPEPNAAGRLESYVTLFNEGAVQLMRQHGITVCDLYTVMKPVSEKYEVESRNPKVRDVHFTPEGYAFMGREVSNAIREELGLDSARSASTPGT